MTQGDHHRDESQLDADELFRLGSEALGARRYSEAERLLLKALQMERSPDHLSQYALALAHVKGEFPAAVLLCQEAIKNDPRNAEHFLRLGIVYLIARRRKEAIRIFHLGLRVGRHPLILSRLQALGERGKPVIPFLSRAHPVNKYLGKVRTKLSGKRRLF